MSIENAVRFIKEIDKLKKVHRKTLNYHEERVENSAEHSWHLAMAVIVFQEFSNFQEIDLYWKLIG